MPGSGAGVDVTTTLSSAAYVPVSPADPTISGAMLKRIVSNSVALSTCVETGVPLMAIDQLFPGKSTEIPKW